MASPPPPTLSPFEKTCPCTILPPLFKFFRSPFPPLGRGNQNLLFLPPRGRRGVQTMFNHYVLCSDDWPHDKNSIFFYNSYKIKDLKSKWLIFDMVHYWSDVEILMLNKAAVGDLESFVSVAKHLPERNRKHSKHLPSTQKFHHITIGNKKVVGYFLTKTCSCHHQIKQNQEKVKSGAVAQTVDIE